MKIDISPELAQRIRLHAETGVQDRPLTEADVISRALDLLDAEEREVTAIREGIDDWRAGRVRDFDEFDREFCAKHGAADPGA